MHDLNGAYVVPPVDRLPTEVEDVIDLEAWWGDMEEARDLLLKLSGKVDTLEAAVKGKFEAYDDNIRRFWDLHVPAMQKTITDNRDRIESLRIANDARDHKNETKHAALELRVNELSVRMKIYSALAAGFGFIAAELLGNFLR